MSKKVSFDTNATPDCDFADDALVNASDWEKEQRYRLLARIAERSSRLANHEMEETKEKLRIALENLHKITHIGPYNNDAVHIAYKTIKEIEQFVYSERSL